MWIDRICVKHFTGGKGHIVVSGTGNRANHWAMAPETARQLRAQLDHVLGAVGESGDVRDIDRAAKRACRALENSRIP